MATARPPVRVRGTCKNGHTLDAEAPKGRVTWRGRCPVDGCDDEHLIARRVSDDPTPVPAGDPPPAGERGGIRKVAYSDDDLELLEQHHDEGAPAGEDGTDDDDADSGDPGPDGAGGATGVPAAEDDAEQRPAAPERDGDDGGRRRRRGLRRAREHEAGELIPGIYS